MDVIIVGAGPAGSTAATLLARAGAGVTIVDKSEFPRFHVGESLLPMVTAILEQLGIDASTNEHFLYKRGAQFIDEKSGRIATFDFGEALEGPPRHAWHIERAVLDDLLLNLARQAGVTVVTGQRVRDVTFADDHVDVATEDKTLRGRYLIDASGQGRLLGKKFRSIEPYASFGKAASFVHFHGLSQDAQNYFGDNNDVRIMVLERGWAWLIPLPGARISCGIVSPDKGLNKDSVLQWVNGSAVASKLTEGARHTEPNITGNFSYKNNKPFGRRYACIGDAAGFIDPLFSSGVSLGMYGAVKVTDTLGKALPHHQEGEDKLMSPIADEMERGYNVFSAIVGRYYQTNMVDNLFFNAPAEGSMRASITSVLSGDVFRHDNRFAQMLLRSRVKPTGPKALGATT